ncbi:MAG: zinc ribbon domain-containing protein [Candidatus Methylomirabilales bacterium]
MPTYRLYCRKCQREFETTMTIKEREAGLKCPGCGSTDIEPLLDTFFAKTSRKS